MPEILGICAVTTQKPITSPHSDHLVAMTTCFVDRADEAAAAATRVGEEESTDAGCFSPDALPDPLTPASLTQIANAWA